MASPQNPGFGGLAPAARLLYARDHAVLAGVEKLRFYPLALESGFRSTLIEAGGRQLLDLSATWTASGLGHGHPRVTEALARASKSPPGAGGLSAVHPDSVGLAEDLLERVPGTGERRVYLGHSGTDACDVVIRAARDATGRSRVVAFHHSYHGGLGVAMAASGVHLDAGTVSADSTISFVDYPNPYRPPSSDLPPNDAALSTSLAQVEVALKSECVACLIVEPIQSDGGMVVPPPGFLGGLRSLCDRFSTLMVCDEVKVGLGRTGLLHAFEHDGVVPDVVCFGKVLGGGLALSAAVGPAWVLDANPGSALLTTAGNPITAAVGRAVLKAIDDEDLIERARRAGDRLINGLREISSEHIGDVRGRGLAIGVELVSDTVTKAPDRQWAAASVYRAFELGAVLYYVGGNVLEITPPLVITESEVDRAVQIIGSAIESAGEVDAELVAGYAGW